AERRYKKHLSVQLKERSALERGSIESGPCPANGNGNLFEGIYSTIQQSYDFRPADDGQSVPLAIISLIVRPVHYQFPAAAFFQPRKARKESVMLRKKQPHV